MPNEKKKPLTADDILKYEIAVELGLSDKINTLGWKALTSRESGRIGGIMTKRKRLIKEKEQDKKDK